MSGNTFHISRKIAVFGVGHHIYSDNVAPFLGNNIHYIVHNCSDYNHEPFLEYTENRSTTHLAALQHFPTI
jgi:hypothetical protein